MPEKSFKTHAPFGVSTQRFTKLGFHPELDKSGSMKREITKLGPGSFNPRQFQCKTKTKMSWHHKLELEEFSQFLGFRNANVLKERQFNRTLRGPGSNDINEALFKRQSASIMKNMNFGLDSRFAKEILCQDAPPPCTYRKNVTETFEKSKKSFSKLPTFEYDGLTDRFKSKVPSYHLPPNLYNLNDKKNVADITKRIVSARGPYECFTGPRDNTTIKNHFSPPKKIIQNYFYVKPSDLENLIQHPSKKKYGVFLKAARFQKKPTIRHMLNDLSLCYRNPDDPGPTHYTISKISEIRKQPESKFPFGSSNVNARPPINWSICPGPGRYNLKAPRCIKLKRPSWVFLSKVQRGFLKVDNYSQYNS